MNPSTLAVLASAAYCAVAITHVYRWRGRTRYPGFVEYLRKSWPVFAPLNCILYACTPRRHRRAVLDADELEGIHVLRENWETIRDEALALLETGALDATARPGSAGYHDLGFRTFYKRGWRKFYLSWYGDAHASARRLCPRTVQLIEQVPALNAAMFSLLPPGATLSLHSDPLACSLRYHLGLQTPGVPECFICVDGESLVWRDGQDFVFDETFPHHARNGSDAPRLILMCDVARPLNRAGRAFNRIYSLLPRAMTVPNTREDRRGAVSALFAALAPVRDRALALKASHRRVYKALKFALNTGLILLVFLAVYGALGLITDLGNAVLS